MDIKDVAPELREKAAECKSPKELIALAKEEGVELAEDQLEQVSGGWGSNLTCPKCGSTNVTMTQADPHMNAFVYDCADCGHHW